MTRILTTRDMIQPLSDTLGVRQTQINGGGAVIVNITGYSPKTYAIIQTDEMDALVAWWAENRPEEE